MCISGSALVSKWVDMSVMYQVGRHVGSTRVCVGESVGEGVGINGTCVYGVNSLKPKSDHHRETFFFSLSVLGGVSVEAEIS